MTIPVNNKLVSSLILLVSLFSTGFLSAAAFAQDAPADAQVPGQPTELSFPERIRELAVAGNGRYLLLQMAEEKTVWVLDVKTRKVIQKIRTPSKKTRIVATRDKVVFIDIPLGVIARYDFVTGKREKMQPCDLEGRIVSLTAGHNSPGPCLIVFSDGSLKELNVDQLNAEPLALKEGQSLEIEKKFLDDDDVNKIIRCNASANGDVFTLITGRIVVRFKREKAAWSVVSKLISDRIAVPNANGDRIYTDNAICTSDLELAKTQIEPFKPSTYTLPAATGDYCFRLFSRQKEYNDEQPTVHFENNGSAFGTLPKQFGSTYQQFSTEQPLSFSRRYLLLPESKAFVVTDFYGKKMQIHNVDIQKLIESNGKDFLTVLSSPPKTFEVGKPFSYQIKTASGSNSTNYKLIDPPEGVAITAEGLLTWTPPADSEPVERFSIEISNGFNSVKHKLSLSQLKSIDGVASVSTPGIGQVKKMAIPELGQLTWGGGGRYLVSHDREDFTVIDVMNAKVIAKQRLPSPSSVSVTRDSVTVFSTSRTGKNINVYDLKTLKFKKSFEHKFARLTPIPPGNNSEEKILTIGQPNFDEEKTFYLLNLNSGQFQELSHKKISKSFSVSASASADGKTYIIESIGICRVKNDSLQQLTARGNWKIAALPRNGELGIDGQYVFAEDGIFRSNGERLVKTGEISVFNKLNGRAADQDIFFQLGNVKLETPENEVVHDSIRRSSRGRSSRARTFRIRDNSRGILKNTSSSPMYTLALRFAVPSSPNVIELRDIPLQLTQPPVQALYSFKYKKLIIRFRDDTLMFVPVSIEEIVKYQESPMMHVSSRHPESISSGQEFEYPLELLTNENKISYRLETCPMDATVTDTGTIRWKVPDNLTGIAEFTVVMETSNQIYRHNFEVAVREKKKVAEPPPAPTKDTPEVLDVDQFYTWWDSTEKFSLKAKFLKIEKGTLWLETPDASTKKIPLNRLNEKGIERARKIQKQLNNPDAGKTKDNS